MFICKRLFFSVSLVVGIISTGIGQAITTPDLNKSLIPPSPDAASLGKYGLVPVTLYEGQPNISVPVFDLKSAKLTVPIALSYNNNGYRPGEEASWVGFGWSVQAGGTITRVVRGMVDDGINVTYPWQQYANILDLTSNQTYLANVGLKNTDTEPDIYIFNINGHVGKFIMVGTRAFTFPRQDIRIVQSGVGFTVTDENGVNYSFQDIEVTNPNNSTTPGSYMPQYNSAWYVSKMISADNTDTVTFTYADWSHRQLSSNSESYQRQSGGTKNGAGCGGSNSGCDTWTPSQAPGAFIFAKRLSSITCRSGYVNFIPESTTRLDLANGVNAYALKQIEVYNKPANTLLRRVKLVHAYFGGGTQLKLAGVNLTGYYVNNIINSTVTIDSTALNNYYTFQYANESTGSFPKSTKGIDMFGYYNGKNNSSLFASSIEPYTLAVPAADRSVDITKSINGVLSRVTYPTGGYTTFTYENNRLDAGGSTTSQHQLQQSSKMVTYNGTNDPTIGGNAFQINEAQTIHMTYGRDISNYPNGVLNTYYILNIYYWPNGDEGTSALVYTSPRMNKSVSSQTATLSVQPGMYTYTVSCESTSLSSSATIDYYTVNNTLPGGNPGPGLRIASIQSYDNINSSTPASTKNYTYSSATLFYGGTYGYQETLHDAAGFGTGSYTVTTFTSDEGSALSSLVANQFYYPMVTEVNRDAAGGGKTVYRYSGSNDALSVSLVRQSDSSYVSGAYRAVKDKVVNDTIINPINFWAFTHYISEISDNGTSLPGDLLDTAGRTQILHTDPYAISVIYRRNKSTDEIAYDQNGQNPMTVHTDFYYDNPDYLQPSRTVVQNSKGQLITTQTKFPLDYAVTPVTPLYVYDTVFKFSRDTSSQACQACASARYQYALPYWNASIPNWNNTALLQALRSYPCETRNQTSYGNAVNYMNTGFSQYPVYLNSWLQQPGFSNADRAIIAMQEVNMKSEPIEQIVSVNRSGTDYLFAANKTDYMLRGTLAVQPSILYQTGFASTSTTKSAFLSNPSNYYQARVNFKYDALDNIAEQSKVNDIKTSYLWDYNKMYPVAEVTNADSADFAYSSFEAEGTGYFTYSAAGVTGSVKGITGSKSYSLSAGTITRTGLNTAKRYMVSFWLKDGGSPTVTGLPFPGAGAGKNGWTYYSNLTNVGATSISIGGTGNLDELRVYPSDGQMTTYCYDPLIGKTCMCSNNNVITYYEYDPVGRLKDIRDADLNVLKLFDYQYQNTTAFYNVAASGNFTRNNCTPPQFGSTVTYNVPAGRYSASSQAAADALATADVSANGQAYANTSGACLSNVTITGQNLAGATGFTIKYTNTGNGLQYTFNIASTTGVQTVGTVPPGTYNVVFSKTGNVSPFSFQIRSNSCSSYLFISGTSATFNNVTVSGTSCNDFIMDSF